MNTRPLAVAAALLLAVPCLADGVAPPTGVEQAFDSARLADDLRGTLTEPAKETRIRVYASAGSKVSATLDSNPAEGVPIAGLTMTLCDDAGNAVDTAPYDVSVPGGSAIVWAKVPLTATTGWTFILRGTDAGIWHLTLGGTMALVRQTFPSPAALAVGGETSVDFRGLRGGTLSFLLKAASRSKFKGELVRILRPDGSAIDGAPADAAKGKLTLDADGVHTLVFRNGGAAIGAWTAKTTVSPPPLLPL